MLDIPNYKSIPKINCMYMLGEKKLLERFRFTSTANGKRL